MDPILKDQFVFSEVKTLNISLTNTSKYPMHDIVMICSHPVLFGIKSQLVHLHLPAGASTTLSLPFRACLTGSIESKFMFRYRIEIRDLNIDEFLSNQYRFSRAIEYLEILDCF